MKLRNFIKSNPLLYKIWFYSYRTRTGDKVRLPRADDHLYFDGYPRSGNTYISGLISHVYTDIKFTSHLHVIAGIKLALKQNLPVLIVIRKPEDAVISNLFRVTEKKRLGPTQKVVDQLMKGYIDFYNYVDSKKDILRILDFSKVTSEPLIILKEVSELLQGDNRSDNELKIQIEKFDKRMKEREKTKINATSALPNEKRKSFKDSYKGLAIKSKFFDEASNIYHTLSNYHTLKDKS